MWERGGRSGRPSTGAAGCADLVAGTRWDALGSRAAGEATSTAAVTGPCRCPRREWQESSTGHSELRRPSPSTSPAPHSVWKQSSCKAAEADANANSAVTATARASAASTRWERPSVIADLTLLAGWPLDELCARCAASSTPCIESAGALKRRAEPQSDWTMTLSTPPGSGTLSTATSGVTYDAVSVASVAPSWESSLAVGPSVARSLAFSDGGGSLGAAVCPSGGRSRSSPLGSSVPLPSSR